MKNKKETIIEVATALFAAQGFDQTSVDNICTTAQVSKGLVYHHFKSKDNLLREIFSETTRRMTGMNDIQLEENPRNRLISLIETIFSQLRKDKLFFHLNLNIMFQPSTKKILQDLIYERSSLLLSYVKSIFDKINNQHSVKLSYMFIAEIDGIALNYLSIFENYPLSEMENHLRNKYQTI